MAFAATSLPGEEGRFGAGVVTDGSTAFVIGGITGVQPGSSTPQPYIESLATSPLSMTTSASVELMYPRTGAVTVSAGSEIYVLGGSCNQGVCGTDEVASLDGGVVGQFQPLGSSLLSIERTNAAAVVAGGYVYVHGGFFAFDGGESGNPPTPFAPTPVLEVAPILAGGTVGPFVRYNVSPLPPRAGHVLLAVNNRLVMLGGVEGHPDGSITAGTAVWTADISDGGALVNARAWGSLPFVMYGLGAVYDANTHAVYAFGGTPDSMPPSLNQMGGPTTSVFSIDMTGGSPGSPTDAGELIPGLVGMGVAVIDGGIYVIGGDVPNPSGGGLVNSNQVFSAPLP